MSSLTVIIEGGGSNTRVGVGKGDRIDWQRLATLDPHGTDDAVWHHIMRVISSCAGAPVLVLAAVSVVSDGLCARDLADRLAGVIDTPSLPWTVLVTNDVAPLLSWEAGASSVAAIVGTGTGFAARTPSGAVVRASGAEYLLSDEGGGFDLGLTGLRAAVRAIDGRGPDTALRGAALRLGGGSVQGLMRHVYDGAAYGAKQRVSAFATEVLAAAADGDAVADGLVEAAVGHAVAGIGAVARILATERAALTLSGSVLASQKFPAVREGALTGLGEAGLEFGTVEVVPDACGRLAALSAGIGAGRIDPRQLLVAADVLPACLRTSDPILEPA